MEELEEIMKVYFLIWEYFKHNKNIQAHKITQEHFEKIQNRNIHMLRYVEGERNQDVVSEVYANDLKSLQSKSLWTTILYSFNSRPVLLKMDQESRGAIFIGIKSFIECFESL